MNTEPSRPHQRMNFIRNFLQGKDSATNEKKYTEQELNYNSYLKYNDGLHYEIDPNNEIALTDAAEKTIGLTAELQDDPFVSNSKELECKQELGCESVLRDSPHEFLLPSKTSAEYFDCQDTESPCSVKESDPVIVEDFNASSELNSLDINNTNDSSKNDNFTEAKSYENISENCEVKPNCALFEFKFDAVKPLKPPPQNLGKKGKHSHKKRGGCKPKATENLIDGGATTCTDTSLETPPQRVALLVNNFDEINSCSADINSSSDVNSLNLSGAEDTFVLSEIQCCNESNNNNNENSIKNFDIDHKKSAQIIEIGENIEIPDSTGIKNNSIIGIELRDSLIDKDRLRDTTDSSVPVDNFDNCSNILIATAPEIEIKVLTSDGVGGDIIQTNLDSCVDNINLLSESNLNSVEELNKDSNAEQGKENCISISCFGIEEFAKLGDEANRLAAELTSSAEVILCEKATMDEAGVSVGNTSSKSETFKNLNIDFDFDSDCSYKIESRQNRDTAMLRNKKKIESNVLQLQVNQSEAGPEIATGLTSSDLKCASQFFKEAAELESQIRKNIAASSFNSDYASESSDSDPCSKAMLSGMPPNEERSAPEGTSSPDPRSHEDSEGHTRLRTTGDEDNVNELLKKQAMEFEEKLLRQGIVAAEKEKELHEAMKGERSRLQKVTASRDALLKLVEQYKGMLAALVAEKNKQSTSDDVTISSLEKEKQQAIEDLANVEAAFSDVHRKYERTKQIVDTLKRNEETLRNAVADYEEKLQRQEKKFIELQKHAEEKVKEANEEFENLRRSNDQEMIKMGALLKKAEMKIISLQDGLDRKSRENQELTQLCDDLISKVGSS